MAPSMRSVFWSGAALATAARVDHSASVSAFSVFEDFAFASGRLKANASSGFAAAAKNCPWHNDFDKQFKNKRVVGTGATACVYLAENADAQTVAVKVGKGGEGESLSQWVEECKSMQLLRVAACKSSKRANTGDSLYNLNAQYIPTCLDIGSKTTKEGKEINFYVMHAAGTLEVKDINPDDYSMDERKSLFAQLVGSVWALHGLNTGHNDLHGGNILVSKTKSGPRLALIDFGELSSPLNPTDPVIPPSTTWLFDYKRDGNAIMAWSSFLAGCSAIPEFPVVPPSGELRARAKEFSDCLKNWGADPETVKAMEGLMDKNSRQFPEQGVRGLYHSPMVQKYLPKFEPTYQWSETKGCTDWPIQKIVEFERKTTFGAMFKCETVPTYNKVTWKTRKDGRKVKKTSQNCKFQKSACYTLLGDITWSCDAGTIKGSPCDSVHLSKRSGHPEKTFDGGCLTENHVEGYGYAKVYPGYKPPQASDQSKYKKPAYRAIATTTKKPAIKCDANSPKKCKCSKNGTVRGVATGKGGCKFHLSRSYGAFCYIEGGEECVGAKFSAKKGVYFRPCSAACEK